MQNSKFYYSGNHPAIRKNLVYLIEPYELTVRGDGVAWGIKFHYVGVDEPLGWLFEDENIRDTVYGKVLDASVNS